MPNVKTADELAAIMKQSGGVFSDADVQRAVSELRDMTGSDSINVGVNHILTAVQTAKQAREDVAGRFAEIVAEMHAYNSSGPDY